MNICWFSRFHKIKELEKTAKNTILALLNEIPNKTYQTDKIDEERIIITYDNEKFAFVGCYIDETKGTFTSTLNNGLKQAEKKFYAGNYKESLEQAINSISLVDSDIHQKLITAYQK